MDEPQRSSPRFFGYQLLYSVLAARVFWFNLEFERRKTKQEEDNNRESEKAVQLCDDNGRALLFERKPVTLFSKALVKSTDVNQSIH
ncbi:hypothetical protein OUZ56_019007 [Daphnia magna]|uniref:Uncharacterized protein n=1 Tax=Daphnia magna TaxID=35525 RepID=A0ABQ9ZAD3_9CRUS|nr:hypothetical protein OUZ56_019007 [Daphnia magna]